MQRRERLLRWLGNTMRKLGNCIYLQILRTLALPSGLLPGPHSAGIPPWWLWGDCRAPGALPCSPGGLEQGGGRRAQQLRTVVTGGICIRILCPPPTCHSAPCAVVSLPTNVEPSGRVRPREVARVTAQSGVGTLMPLFKAGLGTRRKWAGRTDRKSTRLNSSH